MIPSANCIDLIKSFEGLRLKAYMPTPRDVPTIGWGSTGPDIHMGMMWTQAQSDARFLRDLTVFAGQVSIDLGTCPTTQGQFDAMLSFAYNVGEAAFHDSTLLRLHRAGDHEGAAEQFARWTKQKGVVLAGLVRRRASEAALYRG